MSVLIAAAALPCGLLIGLLLGALGGGGSVLAVPALVYVAGQSPQEATAGALVVVGVGAVTGLVCHGRAGRVRWAAGGAFGALGTAGSYLGSRWSAAADPAVLMAAFACLLLLVAAALVTRALRGRHPQGDGERPLGDPPAPSRRIRPVRVAVTATGVGLLTGFFGVGGGFVVVPALSLVLGLDLPAAVGTSLLVILINSATALATRADGGPLDWPLLTAFALCTALGSCLGNRITARLPPRALAGAFAALLTAIALTMAATTVPRL
ncbi:sulfite exporter TauE/SafE family protein [Streptomyces sp. NPDC050161]|uniref:sulfite exporter TauE/SafE family protein n=1 Tax=Streptomyces sp. NPDC050161 TaxID=3365604 RepID=UPI0037BB5B48